ncbi:S-adenosylmethionine decarboxylase [Fodinibius salinus]|uniref:S-adenosylmethionine decarboxylase proenzyme n=1 Tax=Fodinibius salinus TaxID=860790 RepID=A0A5D3YMH8_9BACT|nr:adenosylmethionine decarboxylase [Fodinibius salinus]TYP95365.1 S-adenosylmethionine decarboxylase [Fodinibius salinus]
MATEALGRQILVELYDCASDKINDTDFIKTTMLEATRASGATIISHDFHKFSPHGVSGVIVIAESHVSIHSWPEYDYAAVDIFTCGNTINAEAIRDSLEKEFEAQHISEEEIERGVLNVNAGKKQLFDPRHSASKN